LKNNLLIIFITLLQAFSYEKAFSQVYISNGEFEDIEACPNFWGEHASDFKVADWYSPTAATPDYYSKCSKQCNNKKNWIHKSKPIKGVGNYVGLILFKVDGNGEKYREYIQTELKNELLKGEVYQLRFLAFCPEQTGYKPSNIQAHFSNVKITSNQEGRISTSNAFDPIKKPAFRVGEWMELEYEFTATGYERFLTIGNFSAEKDHKTRGVMPFSYLFIDGITLTKKMLNFTDGVRRGPGLVSRVELINDTLSSSHKVGSCSCYSCRIRNGEISMRLDKIEDAIGSELYEGQRIDLNDIVFDFNTGEMNSHADTTLRKLALLLSDQDKAKIEIVVFTYEGNNSGEEITKKTAIDIFKYLQRLGVNNSFSYQHQNTTTLQSADGLNRDRKIELLVVKNE